MSSKRVDVVGMCYVGNTKQCLICGYEVASNTGIKLHMRVKHGILKSNINNTPGCFSCRKDFENYGQLLNHLKKEHY